MINAQTAPLIITTGIGFAASTIMVTKFGETADQRWLIAGFAVLILSYIPWMQLLGHDIASTVVVTGIMSQCLVVLWALTIGGEPITWPKLCGFLLAIGATLAFALPASAKI